MMASDIVGRGEIKGGGVREGASRKIQPRILKIDQVLNKGNFQNQYHLISIGIEIVHHFKTQV
jgi:hypothetical protein